MEKYFKAEICQVRFLMPLVLFFFRVRFVTINDSTGLNDFNTDLRLIYSLFFLFVQGSTENH